MATDGTTLRCGLLTRVSTDGQARDPEGSLKSQLQRLRTYIETRRASGVVVEEVKTYTVPEGVSGKTLRRKDIEEAISDIEAGRINVLIVTELSRLSRSVLDFLKFAEFLDQHGCGLVSLKQQFDTTTPHGKLLVTVCVALAQFERELTSVRTSENMRARAERGLYNGGCRLLGYDPNPDEKTRPCINEQEAAIVRLAFDLYEEMASDTKVADALNEKGYRTKSYTSRRGHAKGGRPWTINAVANMLNNATFAGLREVNKKKKGKDQSALSERDRYRVVQGVWEAIIAPEQFERVQKIRAENARTKRSIATPTRHNWVLKGILVCDECGTTLEPSWGTSQSGEVHYYYRHSRRAPKSCKLRRSIPAREVEKLVLERLHYLGEHIGIVEEIVETATGALHNEVGEVLRRLRERQAKLAKLQTQADGYLQLALALPDDQRREFLEPKLAAIRTEKAQTESEVALLEASYAELRTNSLSATDLQKALQTFDALFEQLAQHEQQELLRYLVDEARMSASYMTLSLYGKASAERIALAQKEKGAGEKVFSPTPACLPGLDSNQQPSG